MTATDAEVMRTHEEMVLVDGAAPMLSWGMDPAGNVTDTRGQGFDYYIQGGAGLHDRSRQLFRHTDISAQQGCDVSFKTLHRFS